MFCTGNTLIYQSHGIFILAVFGFLFGGLGKGGRRAGFLVCFRMGIMMVDDGRLRLHYGFATYWSCIKTESGPKR
jgi:hypothetical protein